MKKILNIFLIYIIKILFVENADPMNHIIDNIYLGDRYAASDEDYLKENNIFTAINCVYGLKSQYKDIKFMELNMHDSYSQKLFPKFEVAYRFIKKNSKNNILIHCKYGRSRSTSLVIFYLMKEKEWDYDTCYKYIKERRSIVHPNNGFKSQLKEYYNNYIKK